MAYVVHIYMPPTTGEEVNETVCVAGPFPDAEGARVALDAAGWKLRDPLHWETPARWRGPLADILEVTSLPQA